MSPPQASEQRMVLDGLCHRDDLIVRRVPGHVFRADAVCEAHADGIFPFSLTQRQRVEQGIAIYRTVYGVGKLRALRFFIDFLLQEVNARPEGLAGKAQRIDFVCVCHGIEPCTADEIRRFKCAVLDRCRLRLECCAEWVVLVDHDDMGVREPHHPSMNAMDGASKALDLGLISTVRPRLRC